MSTNQQKPSITPMRILRGSMNKSILVKVMEGSEYIGRLVMTDATMNVVLEDAIEFSDGGKDIVAKYGRILIRGSQILFICVDYTEAKLRQASGV